MHPQVGAQDGTSGEPHEQVLTARGHAVDGLAADGVIAIVACEVRENRFEAGDRAACQRAMKRRGRTEDTVAFRHYSVAESSRSTSEEALSGSTSSVFSPRTASS